MANFSVLFSDIEKERFEQAYQKLKKAGCVKTKKDVVVKAAYYILTNDVNKICGFWGQSPFLLEKKLQK